MHLSDPPHYVLCLLICIRSLQCPKGCRFPQNEAKKHRDIDTCIVDLAGALCRKNKVPCFYMLSIWDWEGESVKKKCRTSEGFLLVCPFTDSPCGQIRCEIFKPSNIPGCIVPVSDLQIARRHQSSVERRSIEAMNGPRLHKHDSHSHVLYMQREAVMSPDSYPAVQPPVYYLTSHRKGPVPASFTILGRTHQSFQHPVPFL